MIVNNNMEYTYKEWMETDEFRILYLSSTNNDFDELYSDIGDTIEVDIEDLQSEKVGYRQTSIKFNYKDETYWIVSPVYRKNSIFDKILDAYREYEEFQVEQDDVEDE